MRYTVTTFKVRLEVSDAGDRTAASDDAVRIARPIFAELDAVLEKNQLPEKPIETRCLQSGRINFVLQL